MSQEAPILSNDELVALVYRRRDEQIATARAAHLQEQERANEKARANSEEDARRWKEAIEGLNTAIPAALHRLATQKYPGITAIDVATSAITPWYSHSIRRAMISHETVAAWVVKEQNARYSKEGGVWLSSTGKLVHYAALRNQDNQTIYDRNYDFKDLQFFDYSHGRHGYSTGELEDLIKYINALGTDE